MTALIKVNRNNDGIQTVNARDLHKFLEVKSRFNDWIKKRILDYGFTENQDFSFTETLVKGSGGRPSKEYHITTDMAKELSMVERNEKGRQARRYFIECEKELREIAPSLPDFNNPAIAARAWADQFDARQIAEAKVEEQKPHVEYAKTLENTTNLLTTTDIAKRLGLTAQKLNKILIDKCILRKDKLPTFKFDEYNGDLFKIVVHAYLGKDGTPKSKEYLKWYEKGARYISDVYLDSLSVGVIES